MVVWVKNGWGKEWWRWRNGLMEPEQVEKVGGRLNEKKMDWPSDLFEKEKCAIVRNFEPNLSFPFKSHSC